MKYVLRHILKKNCTHYSKTLIKYVFFVTDLFFDKKINCHWIQHAVSPGPALRGCRRCGRSHDPHLDVAVKVILNNFLGHGL
jgi:hypothetical protein